jgi:putative sterol carrier protein
MSQINASNFDDLVAGVDSHPSNEELVEAIQGSPGGVDGFLDQVFNGMKTSFNPQKAGGQQATVQYELTHPGGTSQYTMRIAEGRCEVERGSAESPRVTIKMSVADFVRLITGRLNGMQAFMTGKLKVGGDLFFAQTFQSWFDRPAAS